jgi:hypothetical protein
MNTVPTNDRDELRLLYQVTTSDLTYFKTQQWSLTYYCLLIDAGLIGVAQFLKGLRLSDRIFLCLLVLAAATAVLVVLWKLQRSIDVRQSRLEAVRTCFGSQFNRAWSAEHKGDEVVHSVWLLRSGVVVTGILAIWLISYRL